MSLSFLDPPHVQEITIPATLRPSPTAGWSRFRQLHPAPFFMSLPPLSPSFYCAWLSRATLDMAARRVLIARLAFGNDKDWQSLDQVLLPPELPPSQDLVVLALRTWVGRDLAALGVAHRHAVEKAHDRPLGFLDLVLQEAVRVGPPLPARLRAARFADLWRPRAGGAGDGHPLAYGLCRPRSAWALRNRTFVSALLAASAPENPPGSRG